MGSALAITAQRSVQPFGSHCAGRPDI